MDVHLQGVLVSDDQQRVTQPFVLALERVRVEVSLDHEGRAVAEARELLMRRLDGRRLHGRRLG